MSEHGYAYQSSPRPEFVGTAAVPSREQSINDLLQEQHKIISELEDRIEQLNIRLNAVIRPVGPDVARIDDRRDMPHSILHNGLSEANSRMAVLMRRINDLIVRLEI